MTATIDKNAIFALPIPQRIELVHAILDTIAADSIRPGLTEEFKQELRRRRDEARAHPELDIPWEEVKAAALARSRG